MTFRALKRANRNQSVFYLFLKLISKVSEVYFRAGDQSKPHTPTILIFTLKQTKILIIRCTENNNNKNTYNGRTDALLSSVDFQIKQLEIEVPIIWFEDLFDLKFVQLNFTHYTCWNTDSSLLANKWSISLFYSFTIIALKHAKY